MVVMIDEGGYAAAITYYDMQKQQMLNAVSQEFLSRAGHTSQQVAAFVDQLEQEIVNEVSMSNEEAAERAGSTLDMITQEIDALLAGIEDGTSAALEEMYTKIQGQIEEKKAQTNMTMKSITKMLLKQNRDIMNNMLNMPTFESQVLKGFEGINADRFDVMSNILGYIDKYITSQTQVFSTLNPGIARHKETLKGYYKEMSDFQAVEKHLGHVLNVFYAGPVKSVLTGKETPMDIIISDMQNLEDSIEYSDTVWLDVTCMEPSDLAAAQSEIVNRTRVWGAQVKSWQLGRKSYGKVLSIGGRSDLRQAFEASVPSGYEYHWTEGVNFLAQFKNIIEVFYYNTVLYSTGGSRQWMGDFIRTFRAMNYYISFQLDSDHKVTNHILLDTYNRLSRMRNVDRRRH